MKKNLHHYDRVVRILLGIGLMGFSLISSHDLRVLGLLGIIPLLTGLVGFCPLYTLLGIKGCKCEKAG